MFTDFLLSLLSTPSLYSRRIFQNKAEECSAFFNFYVYFTIFNPGVCYSIQHYDTIFTLLRHIISIKLVCAIVRYFDVVPLIAFTLAWNTVFP